jgi:hypothetical protein
LATVYGFTTTVFILVLPLITEFYEIRRYMLDRMAVDDTANIIEPGPPPLYDDAIGVDSPGAAIVVVNSVVH